MQGGIKKGAKKGEKEIVEKIEDPIARHWDTWVVQDRFNLRDWYYLEQEENDELNFLSLIDFITNILLDSCVVAFVRKNVIQYTLQKFKQDILQYLLIVKSYPETLRNKTSATKDRDEFDSIEPSPSPIDVCSCGWPLPIFDPNFSETKMKKKAENQQHSESTNQTTTESSHEYSSSFDDLSAASKINLMPRKQMVKKETRYAMNKKRKITSSGRKSVYDLFRNMYTIKNKQSEHQVEAHINDQLQQQEKSKFLEMQPSFMSIASMIESKEVDGDSETSKRAHFITPPKTMDKPTTHKIRLSGRDSKSSVPTCVVFDHLEPSNFPQNRIKTGYIIKDLEITKDTVKTPFIKRAPTIPKRGSEATAKSTIVADLKSGNILAMPSIVDKMANLGSGVIARKGPKPKISALSMQEKIDDQRAILQPISRYKIEPRLLISQLIDRNLQQSSGSRISKS